MILSMSNKLSPNAPTYPKSNKINSSKLLDGTLVHYQHEKVHLDLKPDATPHTSCPCAIPKAHLNVFKTELNCLVSIGILKPCGCSNWISGTFIIPKKDGKVRWISDFCALNATLKCKVYPLPKIIDIL